MTHPAQPSAPLTTPPRSYLFAPGDRPERFDKAWDSPADALILDLEDAVTPERKALARQAVADWLKPGRPVWVRCNAVDTAWFADDLALAIRPGLLGFVLPKAEELPVALRAALQTQGLGLIALVETAVGMANADALARDPAVQRLAFGALDFQVDMGISGDGEELHAFRSRLVLASRLAGKPAPIDGISVAIDDGPALRGDTDRARRFGFGARLCIHPRQVPVVHELLAPSDADRQWAARVIAAMAASTGGAVAVDGKMVDRPVLLRAQAINAAPAATDRLRS